MATWRIGATVAERGGLPPAASRWLDHVLPQGTGPMSRVVVRQQGSLESNERWLEFKAKGTYRVRPLAFDWRARLSVMPLMWVIATDGHAEGDGWGGAKLWGLRSIGARSGPEVHAMQLIRHMAELAWLPELATADPELRWADAGGDAFEVGADAAGRAVSVRFDVDEAGDITRASTEARPYDVPDGFEDAPWRCDFGDHREFGGVRVPASVVAAYELPDEPWEYFHARVTEIERFADAD